MAFASLSSETVVIHGKRLREDSPNPLDRYPGATLWTVTNAIPRFWGGSLPGWSEVFNVHPFDHIPLATMDWYRAQRPYADGQAQRIWLVKGVLEIPASKPFPIDEIAALFPDAPFGCTDDYVIAFAIARGARTIVLDGVGTTDDPLFQFLHRTVWYWIGYCRGAGIKLVIHEPSCFLTRDLYGFERLGYAEQERFVKAWSERTAPDARILAPLGDVLDRLSQTGTLSPIYADSVKESARAYFRKPQHDDNGG